VLNEDELEMRRTHAGRIAVLVVSMGVWGACAPATSGAEGITCTTDSNCGSGLKCLSFRYVDGGAEGGCSTAGQACLKPCQTNADCAPDDAGFGECITSCGGQAACEPAM
jgi:hypothetical protein